jgi:hypothetical protein
MITVAASPSANTRRSRRSSIGHVTVRSQTQPKHQPKLFSALDTPAFRYDDLLDPRFPLDHSDQATSNNNSRTCSAAL